jgi:prepilin-type N-terminal cleavage/methylation domain-containing protein
VISKQSSDRESPFAQAARRRKSARLGRRSAFTLIELLVVVAMIALLIAILIPSLSKARLRSRLVIVHSDLRQITMAVDAYMMEHKDHAPPTRQSCGTNILYQLPMELAVKKYLPKSPDNLKRSYWEDPFYPGQTYRYKAPGPVWQNGTLMDFPDSTWRPRSKIWVPDDAPKCLSENGEFYSDRTTEPPSPARYAVWSIGPDMNSSKLPRVEDGSVDESVIPLPRKYWFTNDGVVAGLIVHFKMRTGLTSMSP